MRVAPVGCSFPLFPVPRTLRRPPALAARFAHVRRCAHVCCCSAHAHARCSRPRWFPALFPPQLPVCSNDGVTGSGDVLVDADAQPYPASLLVVPFTFTLRFATLPPAAPAPLVAFAGCVLVLPRRYERSLRALPHARRVAPPPSSDSSSRMVAACRFRSRRCTTAARVRSQFRYVIVIIVMSSVHRVVVVVIGIVVDLILWCSLFPVELRSPRCVELRYLPSNVL